MKFASGQELSARFALVRALGSGSMGEVWLARDQELGRLVALKILSEEVTAAPAVARAIEKACERALHIEHPQVLRVFGCHRAEGRLWIAMEYAAGGDLSAFRGRPALDILRLVIPIARALADLHASGLVHRDLKPGNVLLSGDGTPKLGDFTSALECGVAPGIAVSRGSPQSASPQQLSGAAATIADDVHGLGALLYELLSGRPPFESDSRRAEDSPRPLATVHPVPPRLRNLIDRCLAQREADRPRSLTEIVDELNSILVELREARAVEPSGTAAPTLLPPGAERAPLRPQWQRATVSTGPTPEELRRQGFRRGLIAAAMVMLLIGSGFVFFVLPDWVAERKESSAAPASPPEPQAVAPQDLEPGEPVDLEVLAEFKQAAEEQRGELEERMQELADRAVNEWGAELYESARADLATGDERFAERAYEEAHALYGRVADVLSTLETRAREVLARSLEAGDAALSTGRSADAKKAFELALAIDADNAPARKGLGRAGTLDRVHALLAQAATYEEAEQWQSAVDAYVAALELDAETEQAVQGRDRVRGRMAADAFAAALARGFSELGQRNYGAARRSFEAAGRLRPGAPEVTAALAQLTEEERTVAITAALERASASERAEEWDKALSEYRKVLTLDSTVAFAQEGAARSEPRARLHDELELYLTQPERLFAPNVRVAARETLARGRQVADAGPVLQSQLTRLDDWIRRAEMPVEVALVSDNQTRVTLFRVGELGTFERRSLELTPGRYTAVGTRPGYRDVRREFTVAPGETPPPIVIRCEERI